MSAPAPSTSVSRLSREQLDALVRKLREKKGASPAPAGPRARDWSDQPIPLSSAQARLWFLGELEQGAATYNLAGGLRLRGALDREALADALSEIVRRHQVLRTRFVAEGGRPVGRLMPPARVVMPLVDLSLLPECACEKGAYEQGVYERWARREAGVPFDLAAGGPLRATLLARGPHDHLLVLVVHHIAADGGSMPLLLAELAALYRARVTGEPAALPELPLQVADYVAWRAEEGTAAEDRALSEAAARLAGLPVLELPLDRPRAATRSGRGNTLRFPLSPAVVRRVRELGVELDLTPFVIFVAAFSTLLARLSGQRDLALGTPLAHRPRPELERLIGFFANTQVLRIDLEGEPSFLDLLRRAWKASMDAFAYPELPFERLVEALLPARDLSIPPLFQAMLVMQGETPATLDLPGLWVEGVAIENETAKFDLLVSIEPGETWQARWEYATDLFDAATIERWAACFERLLAAALASPATPIARLDPLSAAERGQLLGSWSRAGELPVPTLLLHEWFEQQAAKTPDAPALVHGETRWSYADLERASGSLARRLVALGVGPEVRVGVCLERTLALPVALLGVLRAGGAYVPFDPPASVARPHRGNPAERLSFLLADAGVRVLLVNAQHVPLLPPHEALVVVLDDLGSPVGGTALDPGLDSNKGEGRTDLANLAYMIYTSGSTGRPKGVAIEHRAASAFIEWALRAFAGRLDATLAATSVCFDLSVFEIFGTLAAGGKVLLAGNALELPTLPARDEVRLVNTVPSAIAELVREGSIPATVRTINLAGEALPRDLVLRLYRALPELEAVCNLYGPSEDTTYSTWTTLPRALERTPPIGRPIEGTSAYLLDRYFQPVPPGVPGHLHLAGAGLARGYSRRPGLTAERFVPDPFERDVPGARMYRTGDLARFLPDGQLDFLGRLDHQVKIRGFRIELGEIEAALGAHPSVRERVVVARRDLGEVPELVAYVAGAQLEEGGIDPVALRAHLAATLPDPMIPSYFVVLDRLPLTPNGKIDRLALPRPERSAGAERAHVEPRTPTERVLAEIWGEVLGIESVGATDHFFHLGGHSLKATQVLSRLRARFEIQLPLTSIFAHPTLEGLARALDDLAAAELPSQRAARAQTPLVAAARPEVLPLSFAQERLWFLDRFEPGTSTYTIPTALAFRGRFEPAALGAALTEVSRRHEMLRTTFAAVHGEPRQVIAPPGRRFPLPVIDLSALAAEDRPRLRAALMDRGAARPFDLARGPLFRAALVRSAPDEHALLLDAHHIAADGWSMTVLAKEILDLLGGGEALPQLPVQVADHALWQRRWLSGAELERQVGYWKRELAGLPPGLELPADWPRPAVRSFRGARKTFDLSPELSEAVRRLGQEANASTFMTLLAAFQVLLHKLSGEHDLAVGTPVAGRNRAEIEGLIGMFLNTLVLRSRLDGDASFATVLARTRETALAAFEHQDLPFEKLLDELRPERDLSRTPLFQVFFNLLNLPKVELDLPGVRAEILTPPEMPSKFDLTLYVQEVSGGGPCPADRGLASFEERRHPTNVGSRPSTAGGGQPSGGTRVASTLRLDLAYNADLFSAERAEEMLRQYVQLLRQVTATPETALSRLSLVTAEAAPVLPDPRELLSTRWEGAITECFARRAADGPDRIAVADDSGAWSYNQLARASRRLAHELIARGVQKGDRVAIFGHRSGAMAWAVLSILEAGGAFVQLDPAYPPNRLVEMIRLAAPRALLRLAAALPLPDEVAALARELGCTVIELPSFGDGAGAFGDRPESAPAVAVGPDDLAYLAFTSGSTGTPKGVMGRQGPLTHFLPWQTARFELTRDDRFSLLSGLAHDPLQRDLFTPLFLGASIQVPPPEEILMQGGAAAWMARAAVTVAHLTPAMGQLIAETGSQEPPRLEALRRVLLVGDILTLRDVDRLRRLAPRVTVINLYGSTETQRAVGFHELAPDEDRASVRGEARSRQILPLGRGMKDAQLLVVSGGGELAGIGELGEIWLRSPHLAAGYLDDPERSAERFVPNPLGHEAWDRCYRTGDLGRFLPNGEVTFAGRADRQVKIRGFRVELGEIEARLGRVPGVREAVVLPRDGSTQADRRLVAFIVPVDERGRDVDALREALKRELPAYMVPSGYVLLEALPLTPNGKIDREALSKMKDETRSEAALVAPGSATEEALVALFAETLKIDRLGIDDNFFELGGNSLLLAQLHGRIQERFGVTLSMVDIFSHPTVRALAPLVGATDIAPVKGAVGEGWTNRMQEGRNRLKQRVAERRPTGRTAARAMGEVHEKQRVR